MARKVHVRKITKLKRSVRAISPVIATLLMIAIAVVASLVAYAFVMGYMGTTITKIGQSIQIPSYTTAEAITPGLYNLIVYVQNTGQGTVQLSYPDNSVYVNDVPLRINNVDPPSMLNSPTNTRVIIPVGQTVGLNVTLPAGYTQGDKLRIKVVTIDGTSMQTSGTGTSGSSPQSGNQYTITVTQTANGVIAPGTTAVNAGASPTFTITPSTGYYIATITANGALVPVTSPSGQNYQFVPVYAAGTLTATYAVIPPAGTQYTITVTQTANGVIAPGTTAVNAGASPTFTITPSTGYYIATITANGALVPVTSPSGQNYQFVPVYAAGTLTATYAVIPPAGTQYTITVTQTANGVIAPGTTAVNAGASPTFTITPLAGYHIATITANGALVPVTSPSGQNYQFVPVYAAGTLTATYAVTPPVGTQYTITVTQNANGVITPGTTAVNSGDTPSFLITPNTGYVIASITANGNTVAVTDPAGQIYTFSPISAAGSITATFSVAQYSVTFILGAGGASMSPTGTQTYPAGSQVPLSATPDSTHTFSQWTTTGSISVDTPTSASATATINGAGSITATFSVAQYSVTFILGAGGASMSPTGTQTYPAGSQVPLSATPDSTHTFSQWTTTGSISVDTPTSASATATINGAGSITATFSVAQYSVTFILGAGGASMSPTGTQTYPAGSQVPLSATPDSTHTFSQWTTTGSISVDTPTSASATATINGAGSITATFSATHGVFSAFTVTAPGGGAIGTQNAGAQYQITVTAVDGYGQPVTTYTGNPSLTSSSWAGTLNLGTFVGGTQTGYVTSTIAGPTTITATDGQNTGTSTQFTVNPGAFAQFTFSSIGTTQVAGTGFSVTITAVDSLGNLVPTFTGLATLADSSGAINPTSCSFNAGSWTGPITISKVISNDAIIATDTASTKNGQSGVFNVVPGALASFAFGPVGNSQAVGVAFSVTITAQDSSGNTITSYTGPAVLSDQTGSITPITTGTFTNGVCSNVMVTITKISTSDYITATDSASGMKGTSLAFSVSPGALNHFTIGAISSPQKVGATITVTITAYDQYGNLKTDYAGPATLSDLSGSLSPTSTGAFSNGACSASVTITKMYSADSITVTDSSNIKATSNNFDVIAGDAAKFAVSNISSPQVAGTAIAVTITAQDVGGNTVTSYTGPATLSDLSNSINPTSTGTTFASGVWSGTVTITKTYTADAITVTDGSSIGTSNPFDVNPAALKSFTIGAISSPQNAGPPGFAITATAYDQYGNVKTDYAGPAALSDSSNSINITSTGAFTNGVCTVAVSIGKVNTGDQITVTDSGTGIYVQSNPFNVIAGTLAHFVFNNIVDQTAGITFSVTITAEDSTGNTLLNYAGSAGFTDTSGTISLKSTGVFVNGVLTAQVSISKAYTSDIITATDGSTGATGQSNPFNVIPGAATKLVYTAGTGQSILDSTPSAVITVQLQDSNGNPVTAGTSGVVVTLSTSTSSTGAFYSDPAGHTKITTKTIANGQTSASYYYMDTASGTPTLTASSGTLTPATMPITIASYTLSFSAAQSLAPGQMSAVITITRSMDIGNILTSIPVALSSSDGIGKFYASASGGTPITSVTINLLSATATVYFSDTASGTPILTATSTGYTPATVQFTIYTPTLDHFTIVAQGGGNIATQTSGKAFGITITAIDQNGNTYIGYTGTNTLTVSTGTITPSPTTAFASGVWTGSVTVTESATSSISITTTGNSKSGTSNTFSVVVLALDHFTVTASSYTQTAGTAFTITITAIDQQGNSFTGYTGTNQLTVSSGTLSQTTVTVTNGVGTASETITKSGSVTISTSDGNGHTGTSNSFTINPGALASFTMTGYPSSATAGISFGSSHNVVVTAYDAYGNLATNFRGTVTFTSTDAQATLPSSYTFTSGDNGAHTFSGTGFILGTAGSQTIKVASGSVSLTSNAITVSVGAFDHFSFSNIVAQHSGVAFTVTITAVDIDNNPVTSGYGSATQTLSGHSLGSGGSETPSSVTFTNGVWTGSVTVTVSSTRSNVYLQVGSIASSISNTFQVSRP